MEALAVLGTIINLTRRGFEMEIDTLKHANTPLSALRAISLCLCAITVVTMITNLSYLIVSILSTVLIITLIVVVSVQFIYTSLYCLVRNILGSLPCEYEDESF